ncbi:hypothetical protein ANTQUA_LOCUS4244 [Anthophora quadrimaculata]
MFGENSIESLYNRINDVKRVLYVHRNNWFTVTWFLLLEPETISIRDNHTHTRARSTNTINVRWDSICRKRSRFVSRFSDSHVNNGRQNTNSKIRDVQGYKLH